VQFRLADGLLSARLSPWRRLTGLPLRWLCLECCRSRWSPSLFSGAKVSAVALGKIEIPPCLAMEDAPAANSESLGAIAPLARVLAAKTSATAMLPPGICCCPTVMS